MKESNNIGIVIATGFEAKPFLGGFNLKKIEKKYFKVYNEDNIYLIISGIGMINSAIATAYLAEQFNISQLFNIGSCGAVKRQYDVGSILHIDKIFDNISLELFSKKIRYLKPDILSGFETACLSTQAQPVVDRDEREKIARYADLVDMEGAAFMHTCKVFSKSSYLFKIVSDTPEHLEKLDIIMNIKKTAPIMFEFFKDEVYNKFYSG